MDDFTRERLDIAVDFGISGGYVVSVLERIGQFRGLPRAIRTDQGPEFTSRVMDRWAYAKQVALKLITAGKPTENAYVESFNGKFRDECLNDHYFNNLAHARAVIADWRRDYNESRPHSPSVACLRLSTLRVIERKRMAGRVRRSVKLST